MRNLNRHQSTETQQWMREEITKVKFGCKIQDPTNLGTFSNFLFYFNLIETNKPLLNRSLNKSLDEHIKRRPKNHKIGTCLNRGHLANKINKQSSLQLFCRWHVHDDKSSQEPSIITNIITTSDARLTQILRIGLINTKEVEPCATRSRNNKCME